MENLKKSNELLEAIINGTAFDSETGMIWQHWLEGISKQVDMNNIELGLVVNDSKDESSCYVVRDWMSTELYEFNSFDEALAKFKELRDIENECDIQIYKIIDEYNNVD